MAKEGAGFYSSMEEDSVTGPVGSGDMREGFLEEVITRTDSGRIVGMNSMNTGVGK